MFWKRLVSFIYLVLICSVCMFAVMIIVPILSESYSQGQNQVLTLKNDFVSGKVDVYNADGLPDLFKLERVQKDNLFVNYIHIYNDNGFSASGGIEQKFKFFRLGKYSPYPWQKVIQTSLPNLSRSGKFTVDLIVNVVSREILRMVLLRTIGILIFVLILAIMYRSIENGIIRKSKLKLASSGSQDIFLSKKKVKQKPKIAKTGFASNIPERTVFTDNKMIDSSQDNKVDTDFLNSLDNLLNTEESDEINGLNSYDKNKDIASGAILDYLEGNDTFNIEDKAEELRDSVGTSETRALYGEDDALNFEDKNLKVEDKFLDDFDDNRLDGKYQLDPENEPIFKKFPEPLLLKSLVQSSPSNISDTQSEEEKDGFRFSSTEFESIMNNSEILTLVGDELKKSEKEGEDFSLLVFSLKFQKGIREVRNFFLERKNLAVRDLSLYTYGVFIKKMSLEQIYGIAGEFAYFMQKYSNMVAIGISSSYGRHVQVHHLIKESLSALSEAIDSGVCITGFRPDIKMYNEIYGNSNDTSDVNIK